MYVEQINNALWYVIFRYCLKQKETVTNYNSISIEKIVIHNAKHKIKYTYL